MAAWMPSFHKECSSKSVLERKSRDFKLKLRYMIWETLNQILQTWLSIDVVNETYSPEAKGFSIDAAGLSAHSSEQCIHPIMSAWDACRKSIHQEEINGVVLAEIALESYTIVESQTRCRFWMTLLFHLRTPKQSSTNDATSVPRDTSESLSASLLESLRISTFPTR